MELPNPRAIEGGNIDPNPVGASAGVGGNPKLGKARGGGALNDGATPENKNGLNKPESEFSPRTRAKSTYFDFNTVK